MGELSNRRLAIDRLGSYGSAFLLCWGLLVVRGWDRLVQPHLWAEDGAVYLHDALVTPWLGIFHLYGGYLQVAQRLVVQLLALFPLSWLPALITLVSYLLYAAFVAQIARSAFRDYVPSDGARVVAAAMLCFLPGMGEVAGNVANIFRPMFVFTWFVALKPPRLGLRSWELVLMTLFAFSAGQVIMIVPMLLFRAYYQVREQQPRPIIFREVAAILIVLLSATVTLFQPAALSDSAPRPASVIWGTAHLLPSVLVHQPWLGPEWTIKLATDYNVLSWIVGVCVLIAIAWLLLTRWGLAGRQLLLGLLAAYSIWPLAFIVRPAALTVVREAPGFFWSMRYGYQMAPFAVILWVALCFPRDLLRKRSLQLAAVFAVVFLLNNYGYSSIEAYGTELDWQTDIAELETALATGCPSEVLIPIYPRTPPWAIRYQGDTERCQPALPGGDERTKPALETPGER